MQCLSVHPGPLLGEASLGEQTDSVTLWGLGRGQGRGGGPCGSRHQAGWGTGARCPHSPLPVTALPWCGAVSSPGRVAGALLKAGGRGTTQPAPAPPPHPQGGTSFDEHGAFPLSLMLLEISDSIKPCDEKQIKAREILDETILF